MEHSMLQRNNLNWRARKQTAERRLPTCTLNSTLSPLRGSLRLQSAAGMADLLAVEPRTLGFVLDERPSSTLTLRVRSLRVFWPGCRCCSLIHLLLLQNVSCATCAYKVRVSKVERYGVKPSSGVLAPGGSVEIAIVRRRTQGATPEALGPNPVRSSSARGGRRRGAPPAISSWTGLPDDQTLLADPKAGNP